jgi:hypothetical protein
VVITLGEEAAATGTTELIGTGRLAKGVAMEDKTSSQQSSIPLYPFDMASIVQYPSYKPPPKDLELLRMVYLKGHNEGFEDGRRAGLRAAEALAPAGRDPYVLLTLGVLLGLFVGLFISQAMVG